MVFYPLLKILVIVHKSKYGKKLMNTAIKTGKNFSSKYGKKLTDTAIKTGKYFATIAGKKNSS